MLRPLVAYYKDGTMSAFAAFTLFHSLIGVIGIVFGFVALVQMRRRHISEAVTVTFLSTTAATSVTGFFFPFVQFLPAHAVGIVSLIVLPVAVFALYGRQLVGKWRITYAVTALAALYFNTLVLLAQGFRRIPVLQALAPTESEPPFFIAQVLLLAAFSAVCIPTVQRFAGRPASQFGNALTR
jgi:hypothetical protein